ncbi:unnamed protein product [Rhizophagus irregularis]|nr:unnamed protein product [Rhizophagus irregularis]CAB5355556.1 unnamed protein product [Rhizophagus irregularis]
MYTTGSYNQLIFVGSQVPGPNSLWKIVFDKELATYNNTSIKFQHIKSGNKFLGIHYDRYILLDYYKSPSTNLTEVGCCDYSSDNCWDDSWKFNDSELEDHQGYLKSNDIINLSIEKRYDNNKVEFLRSHDIPFTVGNDTFQEVICHNESLEENDEWCIELIKQHNWTIDNLQS